MRYLISFLLLLYCSTAFAGQGMYPVPMVYIADGGATTTDYTDDTDCVGAYFMDDTGNELDESGNSSTLTEDGTVSTSTTVPSGYSGTSRDIDGSSYFTQSDGGGLSINGASAEITVAMWVKFEGTTSADQAFFYKYHTTGDNRQIQFKYDNTDDNLEAIISSDGSAFTKLSCSTTLSTLGTSWHHVALVSDGSTIEIFIDGTSDGSIAHTSGIYDGDQDVGIGAAPNGDYDFNGLMDELIVFDRALTSTEINELMDDGISGDTGGSD